jgi:hypothetical protein
MDPSPEPMAVVDDIQFPSNPQPPVEIIQDYTNPVLVYNVNPWFKKIAWPTSFVAEMESLSRNRSDNVRYVLLMELDDVEFEKKLKEASSRLVSNAMIEITGQCYKIRDSLYDTSAKLTEFYRRSGNTSQVNEEVTRLETELMCLDELTTVMKGMLRCSMARCMAFGRRERQMYRTKTHPIYNLKDYEHMKSIHLPDVLYFMGYIDEKVLCDPPRLAAAIAKFKSMPEQVLAFYRNMEEVLRRIIPTDAEDVGMIRAWGERIRKEIRK